MLRSKLFVISILSATALFIASCNDHPDDTATSAVSDPPGPTVSNPSIQTTAAPLGSGTVSLSWSAASDSSTSAAALVYQVCASDEDPQFGTFSTLAQVSAGTCTTLAPGVTTASVSVTTRRTYFFNVIVTNAANGSSVYAPKGEFVDSTYQLSYYPLENNRTDVVSGNNLSVASYNGATANLGSGATDQHGWSNMAYAFTGSSSSECLMSTSSASSSVTGQNPRSVAFWINPTNASGTYVPFSIGDVLSAGVHFGLRGSGTWSDWFFGDDPSTNQSVTTGWQFWVLTYAGGNYGGAMKTYLNAVPVASFTDWASMAAIPNTDSTSPYYIGCSVDGTSGDTGNLESYFQGSISGLRVFDRALCGGDCVTMERTPLPDDEILNLYAVTSPTAPSGVYLSGVGVVGAPGSYTYGFSGLSAATTVQNEFAVTNNGSESTLGNVSITSPVTLNCIHSGSNCTQASSATLVISSDDCSGETLEYGEHCIFTITLTDTNGGDPAGVDFGFSSSAASVTVPYGGGSSSVTASLSYPGAEASTPYTIGGTLTNLGHGETVTLENNDGDSLELSSNGSFTFSDAAVNGADYDVTVSTQPSGQNCSVSSASSSIDAANVTNIAVTCTTTTPLIFLTAGTTTGNIKGSAATDIAGADALCMSDASYPGTGTYKALIVDSVNRVACISANCATDGASENTNWVLAPSTTYYQSNGTTTIGTTTVAGIFTFPLTNAFMGTAHLFWSGLNINWQSDTSNCANWTSASSGIGGGIAGEANSTSDLILDDELSNCSDAAIPLICVEQ